MIRSCSLILLALFSFGFPLSATADEAADVQAIKAVLTGEEDAEWAGNVEKVISYFSQDCIWCGPSLETIYSSGNNEFIDPVTYEIAYSTFDEARKSVENYRTNPEYLKKYPSFKHRNIVEQVRVKGDVGIAVEKRIREWTDDKTNDNVRQTMRNLWTFRKIKGEWKIINVFAWFEVSQQAFKMRPPK